MHRPQTLQAEQFEHVIVRRAAAWPPPQQAHMARSLVQIGYP